MVGEGVEFEGSCGLCTDIGNEISWIHEARGRLQEQQQRGRAPPEALNVCSNANRHGTRVYPIKMDQCHRRVHVKVDSGGKGGTCGTIGTLSHLLFHLNHHEHVQYVHSWTEEDKKFGLLFIY